MRLAALSSDEMTPEQVGLYREILGGPRGQGPRAVLLATGAGGLACLFNAMLYAPDVGHALQELGAAIRFRTQLAPRIRELAILVVAQHWDSGYVRASHEAIGREAGLTEPGDRRAAVRRRPEVHRRAGKVAYATVLSLALVTRSSTWTTRNTPRRRPRSASRPWSSCPRWSATTRRCRRCS